MTADPAFDTSHDEDQADEPVGDPHADCWGIHLGPDGEHYDCDGQPI